MLPPRYGKVPYEDMTTEEKAVVNEFDGGAEEYMKVYLQRDKFIVQNPMDLLSLPEAVQKIGSGRFYTGWKYMKQEFLLDFRMEEFVCVI